MPGPLLAPERIAAGAVAATIGGAWVTWLAVLALGYGVGAAAACGLMLALAVVAVVVPRRGRARAAGDRESTHAARAWSRLPRPLWKWWLATTAPLSALLAYLDSTHYLPRLADGGWGSAGSTWGDLALHASLTARFAEQPRFEWDLPLLVNAPLTYPFLPDFWSGVLHRGGFSMRWALLAPTLLLGLALVQLLFFAGWRVTRSRCGAAMASLLVLFDGSAAGLGVLWRELRENGRPFFEYLREVRHDFAHVPSINLRFSNIVCDALLPQRGMLAGLCVFLVAALLLRGAWEVEERRGARSTGALLAAGLLLGALPFVHVHTFLVLAGVLAWLAVARLVQRRAGAWRWAVALAIGIALAAPQLAWQLGHSYDHSFSHWNVGWMAERGENPFAFWLRNLGVLLPFLAAAPWWLRRFTARGFWLHLLAPCLALFAIANVYLFQPHAYDNLKLLFYAYLALALGTARLLASWWRRGWSGRAAAVLCLLLATASGGVSILREALLRWPLLDGEAVRVGFALRQLTPPDARILTADAHDHPVPMVAGRRIVLGYRGWLWTYGLDVGPVLEDVKAIYAGGPEALALLRRYGVSYVMVGPEERRAFAVNEQFFAGFFPLRADIGAYKLYEFGPSVVGPPAGWNDSAEAGSLPANRSASK